jgi:hypothetical protein
MHKTYFGKRDPRPPCDSRQAQTGDERFDDIFNPNSASFGLATEILGMPRIFTLAQLENRYHELVRKFHPDRGGDGLTAQRIIAAYTYLRTRA